MDSAQRLKLMTRLSQLSGGDLELFFSSYGLGRAFAAPSKGWGKAKRIGAALAVAEERGDAHAILEAAAEHFSLAGDDESKADDPAPERRFWLDDVTVPVSAPADETERRAVPIEQPRDRGIETADDQLRRRVFDAWNATGEWPIARVLQRRIERDGVRLDVEATARKLDRGVGYIEQNHNGRVVLRIGGLVRTPGAERYVSAFIAVIQLAYARYRDTDSDDAPTLSDETLRSELSMDPELTRRLYSLLEGEWFLLESGSSSSDGTWRREISPNIRYFRDVKTGEDYVRAANDLVRPYLSEPGVPAGGQEPTFAATPSVAAERGIQIFQTVMYGGTAAIGTNPSVQVNVTPGDLTSLMRFLAQHGIERPEQEALADAIASDAQDGDGDRPGRRVTAWLGGVALKVAAAGARVGEGTAAALIAAAVARYLGLM